MSIDSAHSAALGTTVPRILNPCEKMRGWATSHAPTGGAVASCLASKLSSCAVSRHHTPRAAAQSAWIQCRGQNSGGDTLDPRCGDLKVPAPLPRSLDLPSGVEPNRPRLRDISNSLRVFYHNYMMRRAGRHLARPAPQRRLTRLDGVLATFSNSRFYPLIKRCHSPRT